MARLSPLPKSDWSPELNDYIESFRAANRKNNPLGQRRTRPAGANLLGTLASYPALAQAFLTFNGHVLYGSTLSNRERELVVLRVAARRRCDYEWAQHVVLGEDAGLSAEEISRIAEGPGAAEWTSPDRTMLRAVDELLDQAEVSPDTWRALAEFFDDHQLMDLVFTVGTYELVAMALRSFGVEPEPDLVPYLPSHSQEPTA
ncbi:carboxymuconolactone decarboxylase [Parafrankia colletiae]|uniref:Carboxymuconolactone decarboxylase n=1 Tax=Parafrankia colletiae TaxID=573497 RepID=A0A1S1QJV3_9ACTN|nr:carboxymuconolactone decarboxylase family protein [Parafrankia colletiae]MCK9900400.1 carboxymuconolactone decarboxylase family protein [Frankia sp. Cpl3]OHV33701.1 carboxymuconolactone decarboxylase [Parafrankia colletiae]